MYKTYLFNEIIKEDFVCDKKNNCVLFLVSSFLYVPQGVALLNIQDKTDIYDVICIVEYNLTNEQKSFLSSIEPKVEFIHYDKDDICNEFEINNESCNSESKLSFVSSKYGKHLIFLLLKLYNKILLLEQDLIICNDFRDIFEIPGSAFTALIKWVEHFKNLIIRNNKCLSCLSDYDLHEDFYTTNGGLYYVDGCFYDKNIYQKVLKLKKKIVKDINGFDPAIDEFVISYIIQKSACFRYIDNKFYNSLAHDYNIDDKVKIFHALGYLKVWNNAYIYHCYPDWRICYDRWIELGGQQIPVPSVSRQELVLTSMLNDLKLCIINNLIYFLLKNKNLLFVDNSLNFKDKIYLKFLNKDLTINVVINGYIPDDSFYVEFAFNFNSEILNKLIAFFGFSYTVSDNLIKTSLIPIKYFKSNFEIILSNFAFLDKFISN